MTTIRIGLASPRFPSSLAAAVSRADEFLGEAASQQVDLVCFPECYLPGMRGQGFDVEAADPGSQAAALESVRAAAQRRGVAAIVPMEWRSDDGLQNVAFVVSAAGEVLGYQTKNQLPPDEEHDFMPGATRRLFSVRGVTFGIVICHEGWRYPETVRWAAARGAQIVFHPNFSGGPRAPSGTSIWGAPDVYEKLMVARAAENAVYFASVNYALPYQETVSTVLGPAGQCLASAPLREECLLVHDVDADVATGFLARRFQPDRYRDADRA